MKYDEWKNSYPANENGKEILIKALIEVTKLLDVPQGIEGSAKANGYEIIRARSMARMALRQYVETSYPQI